MNVGGETTDLDGDTMKRFPHPLTGHGDLKGWVGEPPKRPDDGPAVGARASQRSRRCRSPVMAGSPSSSRAIGGSVDSHRRRPWGRRGPSGACPWLHSPHKKSVMQTIYQGGWGVRRKMQKQLTNNDTNEDPIRWCNDVLSLAKKRAEEILEDGHLLGLILFRNGLLFGWGSMAFDRTK